MADKFKRIPTSELDKKISKKSKLSVEDKKKLIELEAKRRESLSKSDKKGALKAVDEKREVRRASSGADFKLREMSRNRDEMRDLERGKRADISKVMEESRKSAQLDKGIKERNKKRLGGKSKPTHKSKADAAHEAAIKKAKERKKIREYSKSLNTEKDTYKLFKALRKRLKKD